MQLKPDVLELIQMYNAQYAGAYAGDPETTYDKILQRCNHNLQMVADHFEYADNTEPPGILLVEEQAITYYRTNGGIDDK